MNSGMSDTPQRVPGFPIRTPSDHSSVDSSPRTIAASRVLHRLLMPRHPPCALTHLFTTRCSHPLCNTQHTTAPRPTPTATTPTREAFDDRTGSGTKNPPTGCLLRTQQRAEPPRPEDRGTIMNRRYVPPSHAPPPRRAGERDLEEQEYRPAAPGPQARMPTRAVTSPTR
jgi:hypothetical protein